MKTGLLLFGACAFAAVSAMAADQATLGRGQKVEQTTCVPCHSLRLIQAQRLPRATWDKEIAKMTNWGWSGKPEDRSALLEFLVANYGDDKPPMPQERSADGRK